MEEIESERKKEVLGPKSIAVVTTTAYGGWYPGEVDRGRDLESVSDRVRGDLALKMLAAARDRGYQISVVDGGSSEAFRKALTEAGINWQAETDQSMSGSRRQALRQALGLTGVKYFAWTEPEKVSMVEGDILLAAARMIEAGEADIVIPKRSKASQATYPKFQIESEMTANRMINRLLVNRELLRLEEADFDLMVGPRIFKNDPKIVELFLDKYTFINEKEVPLQAKIKPESWSNFTFFPVAAALALGFRVRSLEADYWHPAEQTGLEQDTPFFNQKRIDQRVGILTGMVYLLDHLTGNGRRKTSGKMVRS